MSRDERWSALLGLLAEEGRLTVEDASDRLSVSAATIRRDLDELARQRMLTRTRGGAVVGAVAYELPLRYKRARHAPEKQRIGAAAASMVPPGAIVGLNGGTTATEVARAIAERPDLTTGRESPPVTVVTNALNIANELAVRPQVKLVVTGGVVRPLSYELIGPFTRLVLEEVTLDLAILGVDGLDAEAGATAHHEGEAAASRLMAQRARRVVVVADASKLGKAAFARICVAERVGALVTDDAAGETDLAPLRERGILVVKA